MFIISVYKYCIIIDTYKVLIQWKMLPSKSEDNENEIERLLYFWMQDNCHYSKQNILKLQSRFTQLIKMELSAGKR